MNRRWHLWLMALVVLLLAGCGQTGKGTGNGAGSGPIAVTVTTGMVGNIVQNVGGDRVAVTALMGPGVDPHLYKASEGDIARMASAQIIFYNGVHLEGRMGDILVKMARAKPTVAVAERIPAENLLERDGAEDPHIWFDVTNWMKATEVVRDELVKFDPDGKAVYEANATQYLKDLQDLHEWAKAQLATIPSDRRVLVTAHDAFNYFGRAYDIEVVGLQGISTASEYGLKDVQDMVDLIVRRQIKAVFVESSVPKRSIEALVEGAKARGQDLKIGGELFSDAMGTPGTLEGTYIGMVKHNVNTIVDALK